MNLITDKKLASLTSKELHRLLKSAEHILFEEGVINRDNFPGKEPQEIIQEIGSLSNKRKAQRLLSVKHDGYEQERLKLLRTIVQRFHLECYDNGQCKRIKTQSNDPLERLAGKLALNLVDVSTPTGEYQHIPYKDILKHSWLWFHREGRDKIIRERFVAIVGADASTAATPLENPIPNQLDGVAKIRKYFASQVSPKFIDEKINLLTKQSGAAIVSPFELEMRTLVEFNKEAVIEKLTEICGYRNTPSLSYEIIAHLLKHRFVDVVVNFNNDELLDNAIEEELPIPSDYRYIYTAGHCPKKIKELYIDNRMRRPIYIKCHGTVSHPNSLRLEGNNAFVMEAAIQKHMEELFVGKVPDTRVGDQEELPLNLLIFGFDLNNNAFNRILENVLEEKTQDVTLWLFELDKKPGPSLETFIRSRFARFFQKEGFNIDVVPIKLNGHYAFEDRLREMWTMIEGSFEDPYQPQGIARHQLVNHAFKGYSPITLLQEADQRKYLSDRLYLEIAILLLQTDGFIHLGQLSSNRGGKFYELVKPLDKRPIHHYLRKMRLTKYNGFMHDTYHIKNENVKIAGEKLIKWVRTSLNSCLQDKNILSGKRGERFEELAAAVRHKRLGMVNPKYANIHDNLFSEVNVDDVMNTSLAWVYNYRTMMRPEMLNEWDVMLSVTEKGGFLNYDLKNTSLKDKKFALILARYSIDAKKSPYTRQLEVDLNHLTHEVRFRPWWLHNKHMVIFLKKIPGETGGNWQDGWRLVVGFYYTSRMLSRRISPVRIKSYDLKKLMTTFAIYWQGASVEGILEGNQVITSQSQVDDILNGLLNNF